MGIVRNEAASDGASARVLLGGARGARIARRPRAAWRMALGAPRALITERRYEPAVSIRTVVLFSFSSVTGDAELREGVVSVRAPVTGPRGMCAIVAGAAARSLGSTLCARRRRRGRDESCRGQGDERRDEGMKSRRGSVRMGCPRIEHAPCLAIHIPTGIAARFSVASIATPPRRPLSSSDRRERIRCAD